MEIITQMTYTLRIFISKRGIILCPHLRNVRRTTLAQVNLEKLQMAQLDMFL